MRADDLLDIIGEAADEHIADARNAPKRMSLRAKWISGLAACLAVVLGAGSFILPRIGGANSGGAGAGGGGHDGGSVFMSYAGPVFPLALRENDADISAERDITLDFAPWVRKWISNEEEAASRTELTDEERREVFEMYSEWYPDGGRYTSSGDILVTDEYTLSNSGAEDKTFRVLYPFAASLNTLAASRPTLTLGGEELAAELHAGSYAGSFQGAWEQWKETGENPGSLNLLNIESWEGYRDLLADGTYLERALGEAPDLSHIPVTVYKFTDAWGPADDDAAGIPNPSIRVTFEMDYEKTTVISFGFHSGLFDRENGIMGRGFSIREEHERGYGVPYYLIVIGDDVENLGWAGYVTGGWDTEKEVEAGVTVTRTESDLETALRTAVELNYRELSYMWGYETGEPEYSFELYYGLLKEHLLAYGVLAPGGAERYSDGAVENLDVAGVSRVFWLEAEVTVPAGGSIALTAAMRKEPSYDFYCAVTENRGVSGFDLVTRLGSELDITQQTAHLEDRGEIEIVRENFGFSLAQGIRKVTLDPNTPHYYLEVRSADK